MGTELTMQKSWNVATLSFSLISRRDKEQGRLSHNAYVKGLSMAMNDKNNGGIWYIYRCSDSTTQEPYYTISRGESSSSSAYRLVSYSS